MLEICRAETCPAEDTPRVRTNAGAPFSSGLPVGTELYGPNSPFRAKLSDDNGIENGRYHINRVESADTEKIVRKSIRINTYESLDLKW